MADVTVMGAGIFGLSIAWACLKKGAKVRVIDPSGIGSGASGGVVGALAPHVPENWNAKKAFQFDSLLMAEAFWTEVEQVSGISPGYGRLGRLQPVADEASLVLARRREAEAAKLWRDRAVWEVIDPPDDSWAPITPTGLLIRDTLSARIHPRRACAALAAAISSRGGEIAGSGVPAGAVVWATGVDGLQDLSEVADRQVGSAVKGQGALLHFSAPLMPQIFADGIHIVPHADGTTAVGSTSERDYDDPFTTDARLEDVIERAMQAVPVLHGARVTERWAGLRPRARTRAPILGPHPLRTGEFIANGGFKIGFGMAPKIARVMADLVLENVDAIPDDFSPETAM